jgi:hypothetical protein
MGTRSCFLGGKAASTEFFEGLELYLHKKTKADNLGCSASLLPFL